MAIEQRRSDAAKILEQLVTSIFDELEGMSYVDANFLLRAHLDDFVAGVYCLLDIVAGLSDQDLRRLESAKDSSAICSELKSTVRRLCELSREVTFAADPSRLTDEFRTSIEQLFQFAVEQIPSSTDPSLAAHARNIGTRNMQPVG